MHPDAGHRSSVVDRIEPDPRRRTALTRVDAGPGVARLLLDRAAGTDTRPPQRIILPCALVRRGSGERPPA